MRMPRSSSMRHLLRRQRTVLGRLLHEIERQMSEASHDGRHNCVRGYVGRGTFAVSGQSETPCTVNVRKATFNRPTNPVTRMSAMADKQPRPLPLGWLAEKH